MVPNAANPAALSRAAATAAPFTEVFEAVQDVELEDGGTVARGCVRDGGWGVVTIGDGMRVGTWEWTVGWVDGGAAMMLAVFEEKPVSRANCIDAHVLVHSFSIPIQYIRGSACDAVELDMEAGMSLRLRYDGAAGTLDACVNWGADVRVFDGIRRGAVYPGFFLDDASRLRLVSYVRVDGAAALAAPLGDASGVVRDKVCLGTRTMRDDKGRAVRLRRLRHRTRRCLRLCKVLNSKTADPSRAEVNRVGVL